MIIWLQKVCKVLNIKSKAKHYKYKKAGEESIKYKNPVEYRTQLGFK